MSTRVPLPTLVSWTWIAFTIEADNAFEAVAFEQLGRQFRISLPMWANGLRLIDDDGVTVSGLHHRARAGCNLPGLERWGWIAVGDAPSGRREGFGTKRGIKGDTTVRPTRAGAAARSFWPVVVRHVEQQWRTRFGDAAIDALRGALVASAPPLPWSPPEIHPSNGFRSVVVDGDDGDDGDDGSRPLVALLGRALTALTVDHERDAAVSLPLGANVLRVIADEEVPVRELPRRSGVSKEAVTMALAYLRKRDLVATRPDRSIVLSVAGLEALDDYVECAGRARDTTLRAALEPILADDERLATGLVPPVGGWRGERPYLQQTQRVLAQPTGALPWHPMVLHRGGWPDGS